MSTTFNVTSLASGNLSLVPTSGPVGTQVTATGYGYNPYEQVYVSVLGYGTVSTTTASSTGAATTAFSFPSVATAAVVTVTMYGATSAVQNSASFSVTSYSSSTLTLTPASGAVGTLVTASGYVSTLTYGTYANIPVTLTFAGLLVASTSTNTSGYFSATFVVPSAVTGAQIVTAASAIYGFTSSQMFYVTSGSSTALTLAPSSGAAGSLVTASGYVPNTTYGAYANIPIVITFAGIQVASATTDSTGYFTTAFVVPNGLSGVQTVTATSAYYGFSASQVFTLGSSTGLTLTPSSGIVGTSVTASGYVTTSTYGTYNFIQITITFGSTQVASTMTNSIGYYSATFSVPSGVSGSQTVTATSASYGFTAAQIFTVVSPNITLSSTTAVPGTLVTVTGGGFTPSEAVTLSWSNGTSAGSATADASGNFTATATVPTGLTSTSVTISAIGASSQMTATAALTLTAATLSANPASLVAGNQVTFAGAGFAPGEVVALTDSTGGSQSATADNQGNFSVTITIPGASAGGNITYTAHGATSKSTASTTVAVTATAPTATATPQATSTPASSPTPGVSATPAAPVIATGSSAWYFAAGRTDRGYSEQIDLLNPTSGSVQGTITTYFGAGKSASQSFTLAALSRGTYDVGTIAGRQSSVAVAVQAGQPILAAATGTNGTSNKTVLNGVSAGSTQWYFADGYTGLTFNETLSLFNPGSTAANAQVVWPLESGQPVRLAVSVPAHSVVAVPVNQHVNRASHATIVTADQPVIAARTMAFGSNGQGTTVTPGVTNAANVLYLAEGSTANGFQEFVSVLNPLNTITAHVTVTFYGGAGTALGSRTLTLGPLRRGSIGVNSVTHASSVAAVIRSDQPVIAERAMYMGAPNGPSGGGTDVFAASQTSTGWAFASGDTSGGQKEFVALLNPGGTATTVLATWYNSDGQLTQQGFNLAAYARMTVDVVLSALSLPAGTHGLVLQSKTGVPFVAEEALYNSTLQQGGAVPGIPVS